MTPVSALSCSLRVTLVIKRANQGRFKKSIIAVQRGLRDKKSLRGSRSKAPITKSESHQKSSRGLKSSSPPKVAAFL